MRISDWSSDVCSSDLLKTMKVTMHSISNMLIEVDGDRASSETYVVAYHLMAAEDGTQSEMVVGGRYADQFERRKGEWRIARRLFIHDWNQNGAATVQWDSGLYAQLRSEEHTSELKSL